MLKLIRGEVNIKEMGEYNKKIIANILQRFIAAYDGCIIIYVKMKMIYRLK